MKKILPVIIFTGSMYLNTANAQGNILKDSASIPGRIIVFKDGRLDILAKREAEFNEAIANGPRTAKGYRLMVLSTSDRTQAMNLRAQLLQRYPDQKVYMSFQLPYIKLKFGNFLEKPEADKYRKEIISNKLVTSNIYLVPETIEIKGEKPADKEKDNR